MKNFFILGNICSIFGFISSLYIGINGPNDIIRWVILPFCIVTIGFWVYFYWKPQNSIAETIDSRINFSGKYYDSNDAIYDIREGYFDTTQGEMSIQLPPFEEPPEISIVSCDPHASSKPHVTNVSKDDFTVHIMNWSSNYDKWKWRARGRLLKLNK